MQGAKGSTTLLATAMAVLITDIRTRTRTGRGGIKLRRRLARQGAILGRHHERINPRIHGRDEGGVFARINRAVAPGYRILLADAELVRRADLPADADVGRYVVAVVFFAFELVAGGRLRVRAAVAVGAGEADAECPFVADVFAGGFAVAEEGGDRGVCGQVYWGERSMRHFGGCETVGLADAVTGFGAELEGWARTRYGSLECWVTWDPAGEPVCELVTQRKFTRRSIFLLQ